MQVNTIISDLSAIADPDIAQHSHRFFKTGEGEYGAGDKFLGIRVPVLRQKIKEYKTATADDAFELLKNQYHEVRLFAVLLLVRLFERAKKAPIQQQYIVEGYLSHTQYINNWDIVDSSAHKILGCYLLEKDRTILHQLSRSTNIWEKRIAMMATYTFIKQGDFEDTLLIAQTLLLDKHDLIHKIVGWMLREVGNINKTVEVEFLNKHYQKMPRTMLRYAIEKFDKAERQRYLQGKVSFNVVT